MNKIWRSMIGILLIAVLSFSSLPVFAADKEGSTEEAAKDIQKMMDMILKTYAGGDVDEQILLDGAMKGMFDTLDDYSVYYTPEEYEEFSEDVSGEFGGIGIKFHKKGDYIEASAVLPETPAEISGLKAGDIIEKVNGKSIKGWNTKKVVSVIRGKVGTKVELSIRRGVQIIEISITRGLIKINPIIVKNVSDLLENIGEKEDKAVRYIRITDFNANVASYLKKEIKKAKQEGVEGLLLDVRDNPGGYLSQVIEICRMLVPEGPVIHMVTKSGIKRTQYSYLKEAPFKIVLLVNERSASASEILAGAIKDSKVGILVGEKTYGKGVIQKIYETKDGRAFKMTVEEYLTRDEHHINKLGIQPDVKVPVPGYIYGDDTKLTESDRGEQVYQMEKILEFLGYDIKNPDEFYDEETKNAVAAFQKDQGMYAYGMADFSTQNQLNEVLLKKKEENDIQLKKAYEILEKQVKEK